MTGAILNLLVNVIIVVLLVVTIGYCWILNRRIKVLQDSKGELAQLLKHFDESTQRASESIIALQTASKKIGENIQARAEKAHFLLDDLSFMIDKAKAATNQVEASLAISRARSRAMPEEKKVVPKPAAARAKIREEIWDEPEDTEVMTAPPRAATASRERTVAALEAVLERAKRRSLGQDLDDDVVDETTSAAVGSGAARSKSEQELLEMIRSGFKG